jgi:hypothetical protein
MLMLAIFPNTRRLLPLNMALALMKVRLLTLAQMKVRLLTLAQMKFRPVRMLMLMLPQ